MSGMKDSPLKHRGSLYKHNPFDEYAYEVEKNKKFISTLIHKNKSYISKEQADHIKVAP
jgi:hypothetical protein